MTEQYKETLNGLDIKDFWTKEGNNGVRAAIEAVARFDQPAMAAKDLIDNPDLNQHETEVAVAHIAGILYTINMLESSPIIDNFLNGKKS